jgi:hypothetical protein
MTCGICHKGPALDQYNTPLFVDQHKHRFHLDCLTVWLIKGTCPVTFHPLKKADLVEEVAAKSRAQSSSPSLVEQVDRIINDKSLSPATATARLNALFASLPQSAPMTYRGAGEIRPIQLNMLNDSDSSDDDLPVQPRPPTPAASASLPLSALVPRRTSELPEAERQPKLRKLDLSFGPKIDINSFINKKY